MATRSALLLLLLAAPATPATASGLEPPVAGALDADVCGADDKECSAESLSALQVHSHKRAVAQLAEAVQAEGLAQNLDVISLAMQAYIYGYPLTEMYKTRGASVASGNNLNSLYRASVSEVNCNFTAVVTPNVDTAYTSSFLDLNSEPMVLTVPNFDSDYYWLVQFMDAFTNSFAYAGALVSTAGQTTFVVTGPKFTRADFCGSSQPKPSLCTDSVSWFSSTTNLVWMLARYLNTADVATFQGNTKLTPLSKYDPSNILDNEGFTQTFPAYQDTNAVTYFQTLNTALGEFENLTARPQDISLLASIARAGLGTKESLAMVDSGERPSSLSAVANELAMGRAWANLTITGAHTMLSVVNGWMLLPTWVGSYGNDYLGRAVIAKYGFGANSEEYAMYDYADTDSTGQKLRGNFRYKISFSAAPPTKAVAFWSLTAYTSSKALSCNGANYGNGVARYSVNSETSIATNADGSFDLYLQASKPSDATEYQNWLPTPSETFYVILRIYNPDPSAVNRTWTPPAIQNVGIALGINTRNLNRGRARR